MMFLEIGNGLFSLRAQSQPSKNTKMTCISPRSSFSRRGISTWHGPHHVAQKFTTTTFPRSAAMENVSPEVSCTEIAGILSPTFVCATVSLPNSGRLPYRRAPAVHRKDKKPTCTCVELSNRALSCSSNNSRTSTCARSAYAWTASSTSPAPKPQAESNKEKTPDSP